MLLQGKTAIVTGGAAGIGRSICERMADHGARVVIADIDRAAGEALAAGLTAGGKTAWFVETDMSDTDSIAALIDRTVELAGRIDALVNNAGITRRIPLLNITPADWDRIQQINTRGLFFCLQGAARVMREQGYGRIVNISSVSGKGVKGSSNAAYAASKAAAIVVARIAANELGLHNINVNSVVPGPVRTALLDRLEEEIPQVVEDMKRSCARGRIAMPEDVANAVVFLCSPLADSITGQSINVDNGLLWD